MTDIITYCDAIERCEDCPRYGDDCDGDKRVEHTDLYSNGRFHSLYNGLTVTAWMPLPKPYREDGEA